MSDPDSSPNQLDQLFAAPGAAPSVPTAKLPGDSLASPAAAGTTLTPEDARKRAIERFADLVRSLTPVPG